LCLDGTSAHGRNDFRAVVPRDFDLGVLSMRVFRTHGTEVRECLRPQTEWFAGRSVNWLLRRRRRRVVRSQRLTSSAVSETDGSSRRTEYKDSIEPSPQHRATSGTRRSRSLPSRFGRRSCVAIARAAAVEISWSNRHVHLARASCEIARTTSMRRFRPRIFSLRRFVAYKRDLISSHALPYQPVGVSPRSWSGGDVGVLRFRKPDASALPADYEKPRSVSDVIPRRHRPAQRQESPPSRRSCRAFPARS